MTTPAWMYLWSGFERVVAIAIHLSLSVLVYRGVRTGERRWFPLAVLLHAGVDACAIVTSAFLPIAALGLLAALLLGPGGGNPGKSLTFPLVEGLN